MKLNTEKATRQEEHLIISKATTQTKIKTDKTPKKTSTTCNTT